MFEPHQTTNLAGRILKMSPLAGQNWNLEKSSFCNFFILKVVRYMWKRRTFVRCFSALHLSSTHFGANDVTRTHDLLITNQLLYRLSYISLSIHDMVFLERHIQNRIYFIIFFDRRQQILLISCHTLCMAIPVYYILYFEGIPSKYFQAISLFPTLFPRIPPITTGNSVVIFPRNFDKFCHYFLLTPFFLQSSVLFSIYIIYLIISFYKELFTFSTWFSTREFSIYFQYFL